MKEIELCPPGRTTPEFYGTDYMGRVTQMEPKELKAMWARLDFMIRHPFAGRYTHYQDAPWSLRSNQ